MDAPISRQRSRNGQSETPASGARKYRLGSVNGPSFTGRTSPRPGRTGLRASPRAANGASRLRAPIDIGHASNTILPAALLAVLAVRLLLVLLAAACAAPKPQAPAQPAPSDRATLVFSAAVAGQIVPCGCSPDQRGGLPRAAAYLRKLRETEPNVLFVDAGDLLFETPGRPPAQTLTQKQLKARTLARGDELLGAAARAVGQRDLALGAAFTVETAGQVPLLDAGVAPVPGARATLLADAGPVKGGLFAAGFAAGGPPAPAGPGPAPPAPGPRLSVLLLPPRARTAFAP